MNVPLMMGQRLLWKSLLITFIAILLAAPLITNNAPLLAVIVDAHKTNAPSYRLDQKKKPWPYHIRLPFLESYAEKDWGGTENIICDYQNAHVIQQVKKQTLFIIWPLRPYRFSIAHDESYAFEKPSFKHWFGTDQHAHDIFTTILFSLRKHIVYSIIAALGALFLGGFIGALQAYKGGWIDLICERFSEIWSSIPILAMIALIIGLYKQNNAQKHIIVSITLLIIAFKWIAVAQLIRTETLRMQSYGYIESARIMGVTTLRIIKNHMWPTYQRVSYSLLPFLCQRTFIFFITLDFLRLTSSDGASIGTLLQQAKEQHHAPWILYSVWGVVTFLLFTTLLSTHLYGNPHQYIKHRNKI